MPFAGSQTELAAHQVKLRALCRSQGALVGRIRRRLGKVRAGVRHGLVEQQLVEVIGKVIVVRDGGAVPVAGVPAARQRRGRAGGRRAGPEDPEPHGPGEQARVVGDPGAVHATGAVRRPDQREPLGEVAVDVEVAADVGLREAEFARRVEQPTQRAPVREHQRRTGRGPSHAAVPGADPDRQRPAQRGARQVDQSLRDGDGHRGAPEGGASEARGSEVGASEAGASLRTVARRTATGDVAPR